MNVVLTKQFGVGKELRAGDQYSRGNRGVSSNGRETYTLESVVAGILEVKNIHVVYLCHVFLPLFELLLVGKDGKGAERMWGELGGGSRRDRAVRGGFLNHDPSGPCPLDTDERGDERWAR